MRWSVALHGHVHMRVEVEADSSSEANRKAQEIAATRRTPKPEHWTPVMTSRLDRK